jgi:hypothetical protein
MKLRSREKISKYRVLAPKLMYLLNKRYGQDVDKRKLLDSEIARVVL